jgi:hypothetical protein
MAIYNRDDFQNTSLLSMRSENCESLQQFWGEGVHPTKKKKNLG